MKRLVGIISAALLVSSVSASAQAPQRERSREQADRSMVVRNAPGQQSEKARQGLRLDEKQSKEIARLNRDKAKRQQSRMEAEKKLRQKNRAAAEKDLKKYDRKMKKILSSEQYSQWKRSQERGPKEIGNHDRGMGRPAGNAEGYRRPSNENKNPRQSPNERQTGRAERVKR